MLYVCLDKKIVDNPRLFVDKCLLLWTSPKETENIYKSAPPYMGGHFNGIQDIDGKPVLLFLWINLWISLADSLHSGN